ncbi:hypothetical protein U1Q18_035150 [Sarracenia purpurea var. burkii]
MSCNGCRILRKGCNENCILRESLQGIESSQAQANATIFVAKFFGRAGLMSFLSSVSQSERPALFQSLLFEACGRTVNPVNGAVGLLWTGNWNLCQSAVETVLRGGLPRPIPELFSGDAPADESTDVSDTSNINFLRSQNLHGARELKTSHDLKTEREQPIADLHLGLTQSFPARMTTGGRVNRRPEKRRAETPSENSEESETTTLESGSAYHRKSFKAGRSETKLLSLFV